MSVAEVMHNWPELVPGFLAAGMICVGCALANFCDLAYVKQIYGLKVSEMLAKEALEPKNNVKPRSGAASRHG